MYGYSKSCGHLGERKRNCLSGELEMIRRLIILLSIMGVLSEIHSEDVWAGTYSGGDGSPENPYRIATAEDLNDIGNHVEDYNKCFILVSDINMGGFTYTTALIAPDINNSNSYFDGTSFTGILDGNDCTISNLIIDTAGADNDYLGLFGMIEAPGEVKNLGIEEVSVTGGSYSDDLGGLVGSNGASHATGGAISRCYSAGEVEGGDHSNCLGGLVAKNHGTISSCYSGCSVSGGEYSGSVGGLVGYNVDGRVNNCYSTGSISGSSWLGGLAGLNANTISTCYSTGPVSGNDYLGGLVGWNLGMVIFSYWDIETSGLSRSDGGEGKTTLQMKDVSTFLHWSAAPPLWTINDGNYPRLAWEQQPGEPINTPLLSDVLDGQGTQSQPYLISDANELELVGQFPNQTSGYFQLISDIELSSRSYYQAVIPLFDGVLNGASFTISNLTVDTADPNSGYLGLFALVSETAEVRNLGVEDANIRGESDPRALGGLVGRNLGIISKCYSTGRTHGGSPVGGLVGLNSGSITDCYSTGTVSGVAVFGGLAGFSDGTVTRCYSNSLVLGGDGSGHFGGLVGRNSGIIGKCYSTGQVLGGHQSDDLGGLVGYNTTNGKIDNSYSSSNVQGGDYSQDLGGLVGCNTHGKIDNSYSSSNVQGGDYSQRLGGLVGYDVSGSYTVCFWDSNVNPDANGIGNANDPNVIGKPTAEMYTESTFADAGWDFITPVWTICERQDYPRLVWEAKFCGGAGSAESPFLIRTSGHMHAIGANPDIWDKHFKLVADINMAGLSRDTALIAWDANSSSYGFQGTVFTGVFDGNDHMIGNLTIDTAGADNEYLGLFGLIGESAQIKNLAIEDVNVAAGIGSCWLGGLVGLNRGSISNCSAIGVIKGDLYVGALVGENEYGLITDSHTEGDLEGCFNGGGLVGLNYCGRIVRSYAVVTVVEGRYGSFCLGGLIGSSLGGMISFCHATGQVYGDNLWKAGGLVGHNNSVISSCYATGGVSSTMHSFPGQTGGLVGSNDDDGTITSSFATGQVLGCNAVGGLVGSNGGSIVNCYAGGSVLGPDPLSSALGGLAGENWGTIVNSYAGGIVDGPCDDLWCEVGGLIGNDDGGSYTGCLWCRSFYSIWVTGIANVDPDPNGVLGETLENMEKRATYTDLGWDFVLENDNGTDDIWTVRENRDFPKLVWDLVNFIGWYELDFLDFAYLANRWGQSDCGNSDDCEGTDLDFSDTVDWADLKIFCDYWLQGLE